MLDREIFFLVDSSLLNIRIYAKDTGPSSAMVLDLFVYCIIVCECVVLSDDDERRRRGTAFRRTDVGLTDRP